MSSCWRAAAIAYDGSRTRLKWLWALLGGASHRGRCDLLDQPEIYTFAGVADILGVLFLLSGRFWIINPSRPSVQINDFGVARLDSGAGSYDGGYGVMDERQVLHHEKLYVRSCSKGSYGRLNAGD